MGNNKIITAQIAKHLRDVHFGGNWTCSNLKDNLAGITWQQATAKVYNLNTIVALVYHIHYYVAAQLRVLRGEPLNASDKESFNHPPVASQAEWEALLNQVWADAEALAGRIEQLPDSRLHETFIDVRYGNYLRNLLGDIEHIHYHLGQIAIIRKIVEQTEPKNL